MKASYEQTNLTELAHILDRSGTMHGMEESTVEPRRKSQAVREFAYQVPGFAL